MDGLSCHIIKMRLEVLSYRMIRQRLRPPHLNADASWGILAYRVVTSYHRSGPRRRRCFTHPASDLFIKLGCKYSTLTLWTLRVNWVDLVEQVLRWTCVAMFDCEIVWFTRCEFVNLCCEFMNLCSFCAIVTAIINYIYISMTHYKSFSWHASYPRHQLPYHPPIVKSALHHMSHNLA
jgi:hypothetical protein